MFLLPVLSSQEVSIFSTTLLPCICSTDLFPILGMGICTLRMCDCEYPRMCVQPTHFLGNLSS